MISKQKLYRFNSNSLQYSEEVVSIRVRLLKGLKFCLISSILAIAIIFVINLAFGSPLENYLAKNARGYKTFYDSINSEIDSLQNTLHNEIFLSDILYRQTLHLDSLPTPMRIAGTGGSSPYDSLKRLKNKDLISTTLQKLDVLKRQLEFQEKSFQDVTKEATLYRQKIEKTPNIQPVRPSKNIWVSSCFGVRTDPFTHRKRVHHGIDFAGPKNTKIYATADGVVTLTKVSRTGYGKEVAVKHGFGYSTIYGHLNKILVKKGEKVKRGQLIGLMGSTGRSTGTHLHYEVRLHNRPLNPINFYDENLTEPEYDLITKLNDKEGRKNDEAQL